MLNFIENKLFIVFKYNTNNNERCMLISNVLGEINIAQSLLCEFLHSRFEKSRHYGIYWIIVGGIFNPHNALVFLQSTSN